MDIRVQLTPRRIIAAVLFIVVIVFAAQNHQKVPVAFLWMKGSFFLGTFLILTFAVGLVVGLLVRGRSRHGRTVKVPAPKIADTK